MTDGTASRQALGHAFERKIRRAKWAIIFEQLWVRLWILIAFAGLFLLLSFAGLWPKLGDAAHLAVISVLSTGLLAALYATGRIKVPSRDEAIQRIEQVSGVPHRPASSYEDTLSGSSYDPETLSLWKAHRLRMEQLLGRLKSGKPMPRTDRFDPFALRALLVLSLVLLTGLLGSGALGRIKSAFHLASSDNLANTRLDAWISPPPYTGKPPLMLADGAKVPATANPAASPDTSKHQVPEKSVIIVRASGSGLERLGLEAVAAGAEPERLQADVRKTSNEVSELRFELKRSATLRVMNGKQEQASWAVEVIPDAPPRIFMKRRPELTPRGSMKLLYGVEDDYGVAAATVKFDRVPADTANQAMAWAKPEPLRGPRWPRTKPPAYNLRLPASNSKDISQHTYVEFAAHPWAGRKVLMTMEAKDVAGQIGRSEPFEMILPEKQFTKPLARAVIEQRKKLIEDHRYRTQVRTALAAITHSPEGFIDEAKIYLGLRTVYHRLIVDRTKAGMKSAIDQLWQIAVRIEDGDLSEAEQRLKDAQDRLAKALENGASEEELQKLMQEMKQALNDYMQQLAKQNANQDEQSADGQDPNNQTLDKQDLERMLRDLEESAKNGSREQAQQLLSEMQDLMERIQGRPLSKEQAEHTLRMEEMSKELNDVSGEQQELMDETFEEQRKQDGQDGSYGKPNMKGTPGGEEGKKRPGGGMPGGKGKAQKGGQQQGGGSPQQGDEQGQDGGGQGPSAGQQQLGSRQRGLKDRLSRLQRDLREKGMGSPEQIDAARQAMERAEKALEEGDMAGATENQGEALEKMRESSQAMAQEMRSKMPGRQGQNRETQRDPFGRPQKTQGPDLGTSVKVPDKIDQQRAREILEELRRRVGEATRPPVELDYLERLLKRF